VERVSLIRSGNYDPDVVRTDVERLLEPLGGIAAFVSPGERVLLKPNLLAGKNPEKAVTTHPAIVQAVAGLVRDAGGVVLIGDSPGIGGFQRVAEKSGIAEAARVSGATLVEFGETVELQGSGTFRRIHLARAYLEADKVINLPKLKTHEMMTMTCAVKNLFGAVVGTEKAGWHLKAGASRRQFARLLLEIYLLKKPVLTIVDGIVAMEGNGPGSGDPVELGVLLAGCNPVAVDVIAGRVAGIPPDLLYVEQEARVLELPGSSLEEIELIGAQLDQFAAIRFRLPSGLDAQFGLPGFLAALLKKQLTTYPVADVTKCVLCGVCRDACPPAAITIKNSALSVDNARCIRCWCCRELCPHDAMAVKQGRLLRLMKLLGVGKVSQASSSSAPRGISR